MAKHMKAKIDSGRTTYLVDFGDGTYSIEWAGCLYGRDKDVANLCSDNLLIEARMVMSDPNTNWVDAEYIDYDDGFGPVDIHDC